jgi:hypothetical protein
VPHCHQHQTCVRAACCVKGHAAKGEAPRHTPLHRSVLHGSGQCHAYASRALLEKMTRKVQRRDREQCSFNHRDCKMTCRPCKRIQRKPCNEVAKRPNGLIPSPSCPLARACSHAQTESFEGCNCGQCDFDLMSHNFRCPPCNERAPLPPHTHAGFGVLDPAWGAIGTESWRTPPSNA